MHIRINGIPAPQGSKTPTGNGGMRESSRAVGPWREAIRAETQRALEAGAQPYGRGVPVVGNITFYLIRPRSHYGTGANTGKLRAGAPDYPTGRPDRDKLERAAFDGLHSGGAYPDDAQVITGLATKLYADNDTAPGCEIWLSVMRPLARMTFTDPRDDLKARGVI